MKSINRELSSGTQGLTYRERLELESHKLLIEIESDSYDFQCHAWIMRWNGEQWREVEHIPHGNMETPSGLYYSARGPEGREAQWIKFESDRDTLIQAATEVLL